MKNKGDINANNRQFSNMHIIYCTSFYRIEVSGKYLSKINMNLNV